MRDYFGPHPASWVIVANVPRPGQIFVVSPLIQATDRPTFADRMPPFKPNFMHQVPLISLMLPSIFNPLLIFS
jgi:hypothetical protein